MSVSLNGFRRYYLRLGITFDLNFTGGRHQFKVGLEALELAKDSLKVAGLALSHIKVNGCEAEISDRHRVTT